MTPTWFVVYHPFSNNKFLLPDLFQTCFKNFENLSIVDGTKSFSFPGCTLVRIVSSSAPGSVSLVHGFIHDKSVPYLFSNKILIHWLKKLAPVNDISGVLYLVDPMWIFSLQYGKTFSSRLAAHALTKYQSNSTSGRGARASYRTMLPEISAWRSLLEQSFRHL